MILASTPLFAQPYPQAPIKWLIPYPAGGGTDVTARLIAEDVSAILKQPIVVDNRPGGNTIIATQALLSSKPDGYTFMFASNDTLTVNPHLYKVSYDINKDFEYVAHVVRFPNMLVARTNFPANDTKSALAYIKENGKSLNYASYGTGSTSHVGMAMLLTRLGVSANHIPYKGAAPAVQDLAAGNVDMMFDTMVSSLPFVQSGRIKALAWTGKERNSALPNMATLAETGVANFDFSSWQGIVAPKGTPKSVVDTMSNALKTALESPALITKLKSRGIDADYLPGERFKKQAQDESVLMKKVIADNNISAQ